MNEAATAPKQFEDAPLSTGLRHPSSSDSLQRATIKHQTVTHLRIALLTGGGDKPYALGMATALTARGIIVDFIGSDDLDVPELRENRRINFLNLRGDQRPEANPIEKALRVMNYYARLFQYAATAEPKLFHILWNNKFQLFDRTLLMLYYKLLGKRVVFTAHNVNAGKRDLRDSVLNRVSLWIQYHLSDHIFVHSEIMKRELIGEFDVPGAKVTAIPFGINNTVPNTTLSRDDARRQIGIDSTDKTLLFFGNIAPYKGLEYLVAACIDLLRTDRTYRLLIVGRPKENEEYWRRIEQTIKQNGIADRVIAKIEYVPDEATELYFKAADVLVLPYVRVFQSGVLFLGYSFGLPAIVTDVGSLREEVIDAETGFVVKDRNPSELAKAIECYFGHTLFLRKDETRQSIKRYANERYSWDRVQDLATSVYSDLLKDC